jgi:quercetin dioxygenase-like cupin family protein
VPARVQPWDGPPPSAADLDARLRAEGLSPQQWGNGAGDTYDWHRHGYHKVLYCVSGSITFHLRDGDDVELAPGDRLEIEPGTDHAATVGSQGVQCVEAPR